MRTGASDVSSRGFRGQVRPDARLNKARKTRLRRNALEWLESRTLLSVLPPATATGAPIDVSAQTGGNGGNQSSPTVAIDRYDPQKLVSVWVTTDPTLPPSDQTIVQGGYSIDGGADWEGFNATIGAQNDPTSTATPQATFSFIGNPSVAFDANNDVYVLAQQTNSANTAGELILTKFDFNGDAPVVVPYVQPLTNIVQDYQIVREYIGDPLFNPTMAVDDNVATYSDPVTGVPQNDPYSGNVYIGWNTDETAPTGSAGTNWNPNSIQMIGSANGGQTFTSPLRMNVAGAYSGGTSGTQRETTPRLVVSQGGQVTAVWDNFGNYGDGLDRLMSNSITDGLVVAQQSVAYVGVQPIVQAADLPPSGLLIPATGSLKTDSTITLANYPSNETIGSITVNLTLTYPDDSVLQGLYLIGPNGQSVTLFTPNDNSFGANFTNTTFDDNSLYFIQNFSPPYTGTFKPVDPKGLDGWLQGLPVDGTYTPIIAEA